MYSNFKEIDYHLERLSIERQIAREKLKLVKEDYKEHLKPLSWLQTGLKFAGKYGIYYFIKRILK
ncbi:MAG: hypothetical protein AAF688_13295 [Bacteroidota bacterium]